MSDECAHWPEVEAADDGRFGPREHERVARHLAQCAVCRSLRARAAALREEARAHAEAPMSELAHRRARVALLRAAVEGREQPRPGLGRPLVLGGLAAALAVVAMVLARGARPAARSGAPTVTPNAAETHVVASSEARWTRSIEPSRETVRLEEGTLEVSVAHQRPGHRFVVLLPDGELEVRGTRFEVVARRGRTERVRVSEGLVALRVARGAEQLVAAGGQWQASEVCNATIADAAVPTEPARVASLDASPSRERESRRSHRGEDEADAGAPRAFQRFADGVGAMGRGDYRSAAEEFAAFEAQAPHDERADDAAWLRVVALRRAHDDAASEAAERYLRVYRGGAHRGECVALVARDAWLRGDCARVRALSEDPSGGGADVARLRAHCDGDGGSR